MLTDLLQRMFDIAQMQYERQMPPEDLEQDEDEMLDAADHENDLARDEPRERLFDAER